MVIERTTTPWTACAVLFRSVFTVGRHKVTVRVERCSRTLKIGLIFKTSLGSNDVSLRRYIVSSAVSYIDAIQQILDLDYGCYK